MIYVLLLYCNTILYNLTMIIHMSLNKQITLSADFKRYILGRNYMNIMDRMNQGTKSLMPQSQIDKCNLLLG